jgi:hypothetical protein
MGLFVVEKNSFVGIPVVWKPDRKISKYLVYRRVLSSSRPKKKKRKEKEGKFYVESSPSNVLRPH